MRGAFYLFLSLSLYLSQFACLAMASDWVEDDQPAPRYINPAAGYGNSGQSALPMPAPDFRSKQSYPRADEQDAQPADEKTAFFVQPGKDGSSKSMLQAGVSRWGANGVNSQNATSLMGATWAQQQNLMPQKPSTATVPPAVYRSWLEKTHPDFALTTSTMPDTSVLNVKGEWDDSTKPLRSLKIHFTSIRRGDLKDIPLDNVKVMVVNCPGKVPESALQRVRDFVARGGYLLTTDWALSELVQRAFPGFVEWNGLKASQTMVDAQVVDPDPSLFAGAVPRAYWKMDEGSELLRVLKPEAVRVLVRSNQLLTDDFDRQGILAVEFKFGRGKVLHLVGHFDNNTMLPFQNSLPDPAPGIGISLRQALATNFLVEGLSGK